MLHKSKDYGTCEICYIYKIYIININTYQKFSYNGKSKTIVNYVKNIMESFQKMRNLCQKKNHMWNNQKVPPLNVVKCQNQLDTRKYFLSNERRTNWKCRRLFFHNRSNNKTSINHRFRYNCGVILKTYYYYIMSIIILFW